MVFTLSKPRGGAPRAEDSRCQPARARAPGRRPAAPTLEDYVAGIRAGDRTLLARAITLVESRRPDHAALAQEPVPH